MRHTKTDRLKLLSKKANFVVKLQHKKIQVLLLTALAQLCVFAIDAILDHQEADICETRRDKY